MSDPLEALWVKMVYENVTAAGARYRLCVDRVQAYIYADGMTKTMTLHELEMKVSDPATPSDLRTILSDAVQSIRGEWP